MRILSGFKSRCTIPCRCKYYRPANIWRAARANSIGGIGSHTTSESERTYIRAIGPFSMYCITKYTLSAFGSSIISYTLAMLL